jgi:hypothetical protein
VLCRWHDHLAAATREGAKSGLVVEDFRQESPPPLSAPPRRSRAVGFDVSLQKASDAEDAKCECTGRIAAALPVLGNAGRISPLPDGSVLGVQPPLADAWRAATPKL